MGKEEILRNIRNNKYGEIPMPELPQFPDFNDPVKSFVQIAGESSKVVEKDSEEYIQDYLKDHFDKGLQICDLTRREELNEITPGEIGILIVQGVVGVAENGAIWLSDEQIRNRLFPFIAEHLVIKLDPKKIVSNMHQAYDCIDLKGKFGVFVAGPSKTADIEQILVVGAHGPRSLTILLIDGKMV